MEYMSLMLLAAGGVTAAMMLPGASTVAAAPSAGAADSCMVMSVQPGTQRPSPPSHPVLGIPSLQATNTIQVALQC
jgi:hypothetical protein